MAIYEIKSKTFSTTFSVIIVCEGKTNYVSVINKNNPYSTLGRQFVNLAEARMFYKDPGLKAGLLELELELKHKS